MDYLQVIKSQFKDILNERSDKNEEMEFPSFEPEMPLLGSGMDSLGFAVLVTRLEDELGFDPFSQSDEPYYPRTFGEFVQFYRKNDRSGKEASGKWAESERGQWLEKGEFKVGFQTKKDPSRVI